jgi:hypothetical protein
VTSCWHGVLKRSLKSETNPVPDIEKFEFKYVKRGNQFAKLRISCDIPSSESYGTVRHFLFVTYNPAIDDQYFQKYKPPICTLLRHVAVCFISTTVDYT